MSDDNSLTIKEYRLFLEIVKDIKSRPDYYADAGKWMDENYGNAPFRERKEKERKDKLNRVKKNESNLDNGYIQTLSKPVEKSFSRRQRLCAIRHKYLNQSSPMLTLDEAKRVLLVAWLETAPEAHQADFTITEFQNWPWHINDENEGYDVDSRFNAGSYLISSLSKGLKDKWLTLVKKAWQKVQKDKEITTTNKSIPNIKYDLKKKQVFVNGTCCHLTDKQKEFLEELIKANGCWVEGSKFRHAKDNPKSNYPYISRPDKIRDGINKKCGYELVKSNNPDGYRIDIP